MKITDAAVARARAVLASEGPLPSDDVIRRALVAALGSIPDPAKRQPRKERQPRSDRVPRSSTREFERNKRLIEAGETFAGQKPSDFRRR
jgi:hypothetical protein